MKNVWITLNKPMSWAKTSLEGNSEYEFSLKWDENNPRPEPTNEEYLQLKEAWEVFSRKCDEDRDNGLCVSDMDDDEFTHYIEVVNVRPKKQLRSTYTSEDEKKTRDHGRLRDEYLKSKRNQNFSELPYCKSGTLLLLEDGRKILIGDINVAGGVCDDCMGIENEDVIIAYMELDIPE